MKVNHTIVKNFLSLGLLQGVNCLIPIFAIPFIVRALGVEAFGNVNFAQGVVQYFTILVNYGFDYSATREIALYRQDEAKRSQIFWGVISAKFILLFIAICAFFILSAFYGRVQDDPLLYAALFLINVGCALFPTWFFQGVEEMGTIACVNCLIKVIGTGLPVFLVYAPEDYLIYASMPSVAYLLMGCIAFFYAVRRFRLQRPELEDIASERNRQLSLGFPVFLNILFASLYTITNLTILGLFRENYELGIYSGAYKIISAIMTVSSMPLHMAIFPSISRKMEQSFETGCAYYKRMMGVVLAFALLVSSLTFLAAPWMVQLLLGEKFIESIPLLKVLSVVPALVIMASMFTVQGLYGLGFQRYAPFVGLTVGLSCIALNFCLIPRLGGTGAAYSWIAAEILEIIIAGGIVWYCIRKRRKLSKM